MVLITDWLLTPLAYPFMQRALLTAVLVGIVCAIMGSYMLVKRWSLLGDAISHAVLPGIVIAYILGIPYFIGAVATGLLSALSIGAVERNTRIKSDAAMGIVFIGAFALGLAINSRVRGFIDVFHILFGNVLGVRDSDLWLTAATGGLIVLVVTLFYKELLVWAFDPTMAQVTGLPVRWIHYAMMLLLSLAIVASLQAVGIALVIAMVITPPATAFLLTRRFGPMMILAVVFGIVAAVGGLYLSYYFDISSGATMVLVSVFLFILTVLLSPQEGLLWQWLRRRRRSFQVAVEDSLKILHEWSREDVQAGEEALAREMQIAPTQARRIVGHLLRTGLAQRTGSGIALNEEGLTKARALVRTHRLWERFLTDEGGRPWDTVHAEAHGLEHYTSEDVREHLAQRLGHPEWDPHGAPIPTSDGLLAPVNDRPLLTVPAGESVHVVRVDDENPRVLRTLARLGIRPGTKVETVAVGEQRVALRVDGEELEIDAETASHIHVSPGDAS